MRSAAVDLRGRRVGVLGLARTGVATVHALARLGAAAVVYDRKPPRELADRIEALSGLGAELRLGVEGAPGAEELDLLVASPGFSVDSAALREARERGVVVWPEIELAYRISPAPLVAVTGTNGKTTTAAWIAHMLSEAGRRALVGGNMAPGRPLIELALEARPDDVLVAEVSSFQLETIQGFRPKVGVLTNVSEDHLDRHPDWAAYAAAKRRLFEYQEADDWAVVNADDPGSLAASEGCVARRLLFSLREEPDRGAWVAGGDLHLRIDGTEIRVGEASEVGLRGAHNLENALASSLAAAAMGASPEAIGDSLRGFQGVPHRMEDLGEVGGVRYINNSMCTNPRAWVRSVEAVERPLVLISGGRNKGFDFTEAARQVAPRVKGALLIGEAAPLLEAALGQAGLLRLAKLESLEEAVEAASHWASPGDAVMLAPGCASMDMFRDFMERGDRFRCAVERLRERDRK